MALISHLPLVPGQIVRLARTTYAYLGHPIGASNCVCVHLINTNMRSVVLKSAVMPSGAYPSPGSFEVYPHILRASFYKSQLEEARLLNKLQALRHEKVVLDLHDQQTRTLEQSRVAQELSNSPLNIAAGDPVNMGARDRPMNNQRLNPENLQGHAESLMAVLWFTIYRAVLLCIICWYRRS